MLWLACHDTDTANAEAAQRLVREGNVNFPIDYVRPLAGVLSHDSSDIRQAAADAMAAGMKASLFSCSMCARTCTLVLPGIPVKLPVLPRDSCTCLPYWPLA